MKLWLSVTLFWMFCGPKVLKQIQIFSEETEDCQNLRFESLIIVDTEYIETFSVALL